MFTLFKNWCDYRFFPNFGILPDNKDELKIIYKFLHNTIISLTYTMASHQFRKYV